MKKKLCLLACSFLLASASFGQTILDEPADLPFGASAHRRFDQLHHTVKNRNSGDV